MRKYLSTIIVMIVLFSLTACSNTKEIEVHESGEEVLNLILESDCNNVIEESISEEQIQVGGMAFKSFATLEEWWEYDFYLHSNEFNSSVQEFDIRNFNIYTQDRKFILPILPEEYGRYAMLGDEFGNSIHFFYNDISAPRIKKIRELYGYEVSMYILIVQRESPPEITLDYYAERSRERFSKDTFGTIKKDGMRFEYHFRNGLDIFGEPFSRSRIMAFYEEIYYVSISLPFGDEEKILEFIDELQFETIVIGDASMIAEVAEAHRAEQVEREVMVEDLHDE
jgi:hypothetical protein